MKPTVGRIVHFQSHGAKGGLLPRAAIVTETYESEDEMRIGLCVLYPTEQFFNQRIPYSEIPKLGHWNWPPR